MSSPVFEQVTLSAGEAAKYAGVSRKSIYRAISDGRLKAAQPNRGAQIRIRPQWIDAWIDGSLISPRKPLVYDAPVARHQPRRGLLEP